MSAGEVYLPDVLRNKGGHYETAAADMIEGFISKNQALQTKLAEAEKKLERAEKALEFYAKSACHQCISEYGGASAGKLMKEYLDFDDGIKATEALKEIRGEK